MTGGGDAGVRAELQSRVTALLLDAVGDAGFVLAGAGAIRQHGLTDRPTETSTCSPFPPPPPSSSGPHSMQPRLRCAEWRVTTSGSGHA